MTIRSLLRLAPLALALAGCAADPDPIGPGGGKGDDLAEGCDDGICLCGDDAGFIAKARADVTAIDAALYPADGWNDDDAFVDYFLGDLNGDGMVDPIVGPGRQFSGGNYTTAVYLSRDGGCPGAPAAVVEARSIDLAGFGARTHGVLDLEALDLWNCQATITRLVADGKGAYLTEQVDTVDLCADDGGADDGDADLDAEGDADLGEDGGREQPL